MVALGVLASRPAAENAPAAESRQASVATLPVASTPSPTAVPTRVAEPSPSPAPTPSPTVETRPTPTAIPTFPVESKSTLLAASSDEVKANPDPTSIPIAKVNPTATAAVVITANPTATPAPDQPKALELPKTPDKLTVETGDSVPKTASPVVGAGQGTIYTWQDGDATMRVVLQSDLVVQETAANTRDDVVVVAGVRDSIVRRQARHTQDALPVFRSESGGELMTLPGGVLLVLDPGWNEARVDSFLSDNGIPKDGASELSFIENGYFIETVPGFPSLELANELAGKDGVAISSPNWWREVQPK